MTPPTEGDGLLRGGAVDRPNPGRIDVHALDIEGWALGRDQPVVSVEACIGNQKRRELQLGVPRPDLADAYPDVPGASSSGFRGTLGPLELPLEFRLELRAVLTDGSWATLGVVQGRREPLRSAIRPCFHPLALTCAGRTGGNWTTHLLGHHPQVIAYRPFQYDLRIATYWVELLRTTARPASYLRSLAPGTTTEDWWLGADSRSIPFPAEAELDRWLHRDHIQAMVDFCHDRIDAFYVELAAHLDRPNACMFVERFHPGHRSSAPLLELDATGREIVLVRDFRDVLCSVLAFNAKRGFDAFGRDRVDTDADYVGELAQRARALLAAWKDAPHPVELLRYEDLVMDPEPTLRRVLAFVGIDASRSIVRRMSEEAARETPEMAFHRTTPSAHASVGRWRRELDPPMRELCERELGPVLTEFGYEI